MPRNEPKNLLWLDLETTGLDPKIDLILEFGVVITDRQLNEVTRFRSLVACDVDEARKVASAYVQDMHTESGLWADLRRGEYAEPAMCTFHYAQTIADIVGAIQDIALAYDAKGGPACGQTVAFDRSFLNEHAPELNEVFNHRTFDVSTLTQWFRWQTTPFPVPQAETYAHRALGDCLFSIEQTRRLRGLTL